MSTRNVSELRSIPHSTTSSMAPWLRSIVVIVCSFGLAGVAFAKGFEGKYTSAAAKCAMTVEPIDMERGMSEGYFKVVSQGDGTCHWEGVGVAKTTHIVVGALVSLSAALSFGDANWVFGPNGDQVEVTFFDPDGKQLFKQTYNRAK